MCHGEGHGRREAPGNAAPMNLPGYRERNGQMVDAGTGEAFPGPSTRGEDGRWRRITGEPREVGASWGEWRMGL